MAVAAAADSGVEVELQVGIGEGDGVQRIPGGFGEYGAPQVGVDDDAGAVDDPLQARHGEEVQFARHLGTDCLLQECRLIETAGQGGGAQPVQHVTYGFQQQLPWVAGKELAHRLPLENPVNFRDHFQLLH